ncbi:DUF6339 family protein [Kitasatospora sp. NPDC057223]|uniref:DUF6339 family protein n=1 Tax=Kitasatospora sp. NPDC057223 TaxID=3346055 RepID=UPI00363585C8
MSRVVVDNSVRLAALPAPVAARYLTVGVQAGKQDPPQVALIRASRQLVGGEARWDSVPVRELLDEAMRRFSDGRTAADAWLAPRLHATIRMTRAEASDPELWNFLALVVAPDYVVWRHKGAAAGEITGTMQVAPAVRFTGPHHTQAFARLWWAAELFRDGDSYEPAVTAASNQDMLNTVLRLEIVDHRPTAQAIVRVLAGLMASGTSKLGDHVNALASAVNTAGGTLLYDVIAEDALPDTDALQDWIVEADYAPAVPWESLPDGPGDGRVPAKAVEKLAVMFEKLHAEAPLRRRKQADLAVQDDEPARGVSMVKAYIVPPRAATNAD